MAARGIAHRVGRRGGVLLFFGFLDLIYAVSLAAPDRTTRSGPFFGWLLQVAPLWVWAAGWALVGVNCLVHAVRRSDRWGYVGAIVLKVCWGLVCLGGWLFGDVERGYVSAAIWLSAAAFVALISGWPEPGDQRGPTWTRPSGSR